MRLLGGSVEGGSVAVEVVVWLWLAVVKGGSVVFGRW